MLAHVRRAPDTPEPAVHTAALGRSSAGAVAAQATYALSSFVLQFAAARLLGLDGLGRYGALYAFLVLTTAVSGGFVGDSLTVLDRQDRSIRAGLQISLIFIAAATSLTLGAVTWSIGFVSAATAASYAVATAAFTVEDALRRNLMAVFSFWRVVIVDVVGLVASVAVLVLMAAVADRVTLTHLMLALFAGQMCALAVAAGLLPVEERVLATFKGADLRSVARFGTWRALQQVVRPTLLAGVRILCLLTSSVAAVGALEAARVYTAPAMLLVGGINSYLFASYARTKSAPLGGVLHRADRTVATLVAITAAVGIAAVAALPILGPVLSGGDYDLSIVAVASWSLFVASIAAVTPFGQLASVRGNQRRVLSIRVADSVVTLIAVVIALALGLAVMWVPLILAIGSIAGGMTIRIMVLAPAAGHANE